MYSPIIIKSKLNSLQDLISKRDKSKQFTLTYHSIEQIEHQISSLDSRLVIKNKIPEIQNLTQADVNFIENEILICQSDFLYWATRYIYIKSKLLDNTESIVRFSPNIPQRIIIDIWSEAEERFHAIMMLYLKARQLGVSTINELAIAHRVQFFNRINALVASSDPDKTKKMAGMMELAWECQPFWLKPSYRILTSKEIWAVFDNKSSVTCQHGTAMSGIARGETPDVAHLSELPDFRDPIEDVDAALLNAVHENPSTFIVLESTAKGKTGQGEWWWKKWRYATKYFPRNKTRLRPVFLPWFAGTDVWPTKTWCHQFLPKDFPISWTPKEITKVHALKCEQYVQESPLLRKYFGYKFKLPIHQQYWWEFTRQEFEESNNLNKFLEEVCSNPDEAFQRTGRGIISTEQAEFLRNHARPLAKWYGSEAVFGIIGDGIPSEDEPVVREIDTSRPYITIKVDWDSSVEAKTYRLVPLIHDPDIWNNRLFIYEFPRSSSQIEYALGSDGAEGLEGEGDNSALEIVRKMTFTEPAEQVAEFVSDSLSTAELLPYCLAIGTLYSSNDENSSTNQCRQVVETAFGGHGLQHQLRLAGWSNFHRWHGSYQSVKRKSTTTIGWETNSWTRPLLITQSIKAIKDGAFRINSPYLIEELTNLQKDSDSQRIEAKGSDHDDRCFSSFISFFSLHDWELYLLGTGDKETRVMFTSYGGELPQAEALVISLNESIEKLENKNKELGYTTQILMNNILPTLED